MNTRKYVVTALNEGKYSKRWDDAKKTFTKEGTVFTDYVKAKLAALRIGGEVQAL